MNLANLPHYWKTIVAALGAVLVVGSEVVQAINNGAADGTLDQADIFKIVVVLVTAIGVYAKTNAPKKVDPVAPAAAPFPGVNPEPGQDW